MEEKKFIGDFKGKVVKYDATKGFGFIQTTHELDVAQEYFKLDQNLPDVFIHFKEILEHSNGSGLAKLEIGEIVNFEMYRSSKGSSAMALKVCGSVFDENLETNFNSEVI